MPPSGPRKPQNRAQSSVRHSWNTTGLSIVSASKLETTLKNVYKKNLKNEHLMKDIEARLTEDLSNFRAIDSLITDVFKGLQRDYQRANASLEKQVPQIKRELKTSIDTLSDLSEALPSTDFQVSSIRRVYDSGRDKAQQLVYEMSWLNTEFYERWRIIIFTSSSPVSFRWKVYLRTLFVVSFIICSWLFWIALTGAYRAHRHRLVWGEKLMS